MAAPTAHPSPAPAKIAAASPAPTEDGSPKPPAPATTPAPFTPRQGMALMMLERAAQDQQDAWGLSADELRAVLDKIQPTTPAV